MNNGNRNGSGFALGIGIFAAGALIGGAVAMLSTPYSGRKVRRLIRGKIDDGSDRLHEVASDLAHQCGDLYARTRRFAAEADKMFSRAISH